MRTALLALAIAQSAPAALAQSDETGGYVGGLLGRTHFSAECAQSCSESSRALRAFAGLRLNRYFGIEAGAAHLGEASAEEFGVTTRTNARVFDFTMLGHWPIVEKVSLFGRLGAYFGKTTGAVTESNTGLTVGVGAQFAATRNLGLRVEWQDYATLSYGIHLYDANVLGISALWRF